MKNKFLQYMFLGCSLMLLFSACRKDSFNGSETKEAGKTHVWITEAQLNSQFFDVFTDVKPVTMFTVRRDAASKADLQKAVTVKLTAMDQAYITAHAGANYTVLPTSLYTLGAQPGVTLEANTDLTLNFAAGDFAKNIIFNIDGSKVDLSKQYAVAYVITNFGGFSKQHAANGVSQDTIVATVAIKNKWDGIYQVTKGSMTDITNPAYTDVNDWLSNFGISDDGQPTNGPMEYELRTTSATQCVLFDNYVYGTVATPFTTGTAHDAVSRYGSFGLLVNFDPVTNKIASVVNYYGQPASNGRYAQLDVTAVNAYDPGTKTIVIGYQLVGGLLVSANQVRTTWNETWTYKSSR